MKLPLKQTTPHTAGFPGGIVTDADGKDVVQVIDPSILPYLLATKEIAAVVEFAHEVGREHVFQQRVDDMVATIKVHCKRLGVDI